MSHPRPNREIAEWLKGKLAAGAEILVPEIADYEVRRELLRENLGRSVRRLDELGQLLIYVAIDTVTMRRAAELWCSAECWATDCGSQSPGR